MSEQELEDKNKNPKRCICTPQFSYHPYTGKVLILVIGGEINLRAKGTDMLYYLTLLVIIVSLLQKASQYNAMRTMQARQQGKQPCNTVCCYCTGL